jgi:hypothetical protein
MLGPMDEHAIAYTSEEPSAESCRFCGGGLLTSVFDTSFRDTAAEERLFFAIQSDRVLRAGAA